MPITDDGWTRSHLCEASGCIEARQVGGRVVIRDHATGKFLDMPIADWSPFVAGMKAGDFDQVTS